MHDTLASADDCRVLELRQHTLHPGRWDELITLFDSDLVVAAFGLFDGIARLDAADAWSRGITAHLRRHAAGEPELRRLVPTARSRVRA
jgi:hypothetical protein